MLGSLRQADCLARKRNPNYRQMENRFHFSREWEELADRRIRDAVGLPPG